MENANIDYVAFAPDGKEVEELSGKEILASLRRKIPTKEFSPSSRSYEPQNSSNDHAEKKTERIKEDKKIDVNELRKFLDKEVEGSKKVFILNSNFDVIDAGLKCWPSGTQPGDAGNYDSIVLTEGVLWRDTTNHSSISK